MASVGSLPSICDSSSEDRICVGSEVCLSASLDEGIGQDEEPSVHSFCWKVKNAMDGNRGL